MAHKLNWKPIIEHARDVVLEYDTPVSLRQLFYRLVADGSIPNAHQPYKRLSKHTAEARRQGWFPSLADHTRTIRQELWFEGVDDARRWLQEVYRRDRTAGQGHSVYIAVEKATLVEQLASWFGDRGLPIVSVRGYSSESYVEQIVDDLEAQKRPAIVLYAGDFDPSGEDIRRDLDARLGRLELSHQLVTVALTAEQVSGYDLVENPGKETDPRAQSFYERHGKLVQVEVEALDPLDLRDLYESALEQWWDEAAYQRVLRREGRDRRQL